MTSRPPSGPSWRKPVGALAIVLLVVIWCIAIASLSATVGGWHWLAQLAFYLIAGIAWIAPLGPLLRWMELGRWR